MRKHDWNSIDPAIVDALRADSVRVPDAAAVDRVKARLEGSIAAFAMSGPSNVVPAGARSPTTSVSLLARPVVRTILVFALGGAAGAGLHAALRPAAVDRIIYVDRVVSTAQPSPPPEALSDVPVPTNPLPPESRALSYRPTHGASPAASIASDRTPFADLAAQQSLLDAARTSFASGDAAAALRALEAHEQRFPDGVLAEEREALAIKTFVLAQRFDVATDRGARFRTRFPKSLLLPAVLDALATIPVTENARDANDR